MVQRRGMFWKWWVGGGIIVMAGVVGCYSAVVINESAKPLRAIASDKAAENGGAGNASGDAHNGGKVRMPITASFDGDSELRITEPTEAVISLTAGGDIENFTYFVQGTGALNDVLVPPVTRSRFEGGETIPIRLVVPARTGSLAIRAEGDVGGVGMTASLELKVINPRETAAAPAALGKVGAADGDGTGQVKIERDATGSLIQSMPSGR